jgi:hypothetical protein
MSNSAMAKKPAKEGENKGVLPIKGFFVSW